MKVVQLLGLRGPWWHQVCRDMDCLHHRSYGPIRVIFWDSCRWQSEGLFDQSFSIALPIQALRGLPCLGSYFVVQSVRQMVGQGWGSCLGSYLVDLHIRHLKGHLGGGPFCSSLCQAFDGPASLLFSCWCRRVGREAMVMAPPSTCNSAVSPYFHGCLAFLHRHFPPQSPPSHPFHLSLLNQ